MQVYGAGTHSAAVKDMTFTRAGDRVSIDGKREFDGKRVYIYVDVDGTLIDEHDQPREPVVSAVRLAALRHTVVIWSGGGADYARLWRNRLFPDLSILTCAKYKVTNTPVDAILVDDQFEQMGEGRTVLSPEEFVLWVLSNGGEA